MNIEYRILNDAFFIAKDMQNDRLICTKNGDFTTTDDPKQKVITKEGYFVLNRDLKSIHFEIGTKEELESIVPMIRIANPALLETADSDYFLLTEDIVFTFLDEKPELVKAIPKMDLAVEFANIMKKQEEMMKSRYEHLTYEKDDSLGKKIIFPFKLTGKFIGRMLVLAPILSLSEISYSRNFPKEERPKKRTIVKVVYQHNLFSLYADAYKSHFYKRTNPSDPLWSEVDIFGDNQDPVSRMGWK